MRKTTLQQWFLTYLKKRPLTHCCTNLFGATTRMLLPTISAESGFIQVLNCCAESSCSKTAKAGGPEFFHWFTKKPSLMIKNYKVTNTNLRN
jgi:hypothetical protein